MIQVIERFDTILKFVTEREGIPCTVKELADVLGIEPPTCSNIIKTMCELGWLEPSQNIRGYIVGPTVYRLAKSSGYRQGLRELASPIVNALCSTIKESVTLVLRQNGRRHHLMCVEPQRDIILKVTDQTDDDLYRHTTGLTILAHMTQEEREQYYKSFGTPVGKSLVKIKSVKAFETLCRTIQKTGYLKTEYSTPNDDKITVLAFAVISDTTCNLAIGVQIPSYRLNNNHYKTIIADSQNATMQLGALL